MSDRGGLLGDLICSGWIGQAPDTGRDAAFLLLTTADRRATATMPIVAAALGMASAPGSVTTALTADTAVRINGGIARLHLPGGDHVERPVTDDWAQVAHADGRVVVAVGFRPLGDGEDVITYAEITGEIVVGLVPLHD